MANKSLVTEQDFVDKVMKNDTYEEKDEISSHAEVHNDNTEKNIKIASLTLHNTEKNLKSDLICHEEEHNYAIGKEISVDSGNHKSTKLSCCEEMNYDATDEDGEVTDEDTEEADENEEDPNENNEKDVHEALTMKDEVQKDEEADCDFAYGISTDEDTR